MASGDICVNQYEIKIWEDLGSDCQLKFGLLLILLGTIYLEARLGRNWDQTFEQSLAFGDIAGDNIFGARTSSRQIYIQVSLLFYLQGKINFDKTKTKTMQI